MKEIGKALEGFVLTSCTLVLGWLAVSYVDALIFRAFMFGSGPHAWNIAMVIARLTT